mgnify:CR=1 FL=1
MTPGGSASSAFALDVTQDAQFAPLFDAIATRLGASPAILVNNAGIPDAQRAHKMSVAYFGRNKQDVPYTYYGNLVEMAGDVDVLIAITPGGAATKHLVNAAVLNALGPRGVVVNIARGSVIDTTALAAALREGRIAAAGLDVYESEPAPPAELLDLDNVVLTPHVAGWSPEAVQNSVDRFMENARRHLAGEAPVTPL